MKDGSIDLVVTDCNFGGSSSAEIGSSLKRVSPGVALIVLTEDADTAVKADAVLPFPCSPEELFQRIENALVKSHSSPRPLRVAG